MNVKESPLYKSLCKSVRKQDHAELLRMLELVPESAWIWESASSLSWAFWWDQTPQGLSYWRELSNRLQCAGFPH